MGNIGLTENSYGVETSSTASFMKMVKDSVAARLALPGYDSNAFSQHSRPPWRDLSSPYSMLPTAELYMLPPKRIADEMTEVYWNEVHILYPFLHKPRFMRCYNALWADGDEVAYRQTYCIINIIFALCCQVTKKDSPEEQGTAADIFLR